MPRRPTREGGLRCDAKRPPGEQQPGRESAVERERGADDAIDALVDEGQAPIADGMIDLALRASRSDELSPRHEPMLSCRDFCQTTDRTIHADSELVGCDSASGVGGRP